MKKDSILYLLSSDHCHHSQQCLGDLKKNDIDSLLRCSDLLDTDSYGINVLMHSLLSNHDNNLNFNKQQWDYLLQNSDLKQVSHSGLSAIYFYVRDHGAQRVNLSKSQQNYFFDHSNWRVVVDCNQTSLLDVLFRNKKNAKNLFTSDRIDLLVDNLSLTRIKLRNEAAQSQTQKNYDDYCVKRKKERCLAA